MNLKVTNSLGFTCVSFLLICWLHTVCAWLVSQSTFFHSCQCLTCQLMSIKHRPALHSVRDEVRAFLMPFPPFNNFYLWLSVWPRVVKMEGANDCRCNFNLPRHGPKLLRWEMREIKVFGVAANNLDKFPHLYKGRQMKWPILGFDILVFITELYTSIVINASDYAWQTVVIHSFYPVAQSSLDRHWQVCNTHSWNNDSATRHVFSLIF